MSEDVRYDIAVIGGSAMIVGAIIFGRRAGAVIAGQVLDKAL